jgi:MFS family permease
MVASVWVLAIVHEYMVRLSQSIDMTHLTNANRGLTNSFSVFETYYADTKFPHIHPSNISWIGSIQLFLTLFIGIFAGWFLDAGHLRGVLITGTTLIFIGMGTTSFCNEYWQVLLAQGICVGLGSGTLAFTSAAIIPFYFVKWRMLVAGIVSTGSSVGMLHFLQSFYAR